MSEIILLKESNCKDCYKCIRHCPVKAISFAENRAEIIPDECILCGQCYVVCPQNAKQIRSDVDKVKAAQDAFVRNDLRPVFREADGLHGEMADALVAVFAIAFF